MHTVSLLNRPAIGDTVVLFGYRKGSPFVLADKVKRIGRVVRVERQYFTVERRPIAGHDREANKVDLEKIFRSYRFDRIAHTVNIGDSVVI